MFHGSMQRTMLLILFIICLQLDFSKGKPKYVPNIFDDCKKDEAIVQCHEDPCLKTECPAYPAAKCRTNLCGDCKAEYLQEGKVVDCSRAPIWYDNCPLDVPIVQCGSDPCIGLYCKHFPEALCRTNLCGGCRPEFIIDNHVIKCEASNTTKCPADKPEAKCLVNPCHIQACQLFPNAVCVPNYCGGCNAEFFEKGTKVQCTFEPGKAEVSCKDSRFGCCEDGRTAAQGANKEGCPGIYSKCNEERRKAILSNYRTRYIPTCNLDGTFTAVQCWESVKVCWCVDLEGLEKNESHTVNRKPTCRRDDAVLGGPTIIECWRAPFGCCPDGKTTAQGPYKEGCPGYQAACWNSQFGCCPDGKSFADGPNFENCERQPTRCEKHRDNVLRSSEQPLVGQYVPQCKSDGLYEKIQCHGSTGYCWCVDKAGKEYDMTRIRGKPDCTVIVPTCVDKRKDCQKHLGYCKVFVTYMQKYCTRSCGYCSGDEVIFVTKKPVIQKLTTQKLTTTQKVEKKQFTTNAPVTIPRRTTVLTTTPSTIGNGCGSEFGCCVDGLLPAVGPNNLGCPVYASICDMPVATGHGRGAIRMYFYNTMQHTCEDFVYSGIGGNKNKFRNKDDCLKTCHKDIPAPGETKESTTFAPDPTTLPKTTPRATTTPSTEATTRPVTRPKTTQKATTTQKPTTKPTTKATTTKPPTTTMIPTTVPRLPECQLRRSLVIAASSGDMAYAMERSDVILPRCNPDGSFNKVQCVLPVGLCWCVDQDGNEIEGTREFSLNPKCPKPEKSRCRDVRKEAQCKQFAKSGNYCQVYKSYMKLYCAKTCNLCDYEPKRLGCASKYGCCPDGVTSASGRDYKGCPAYDSICDMDPVVGPCYGSIERFFYNTTSSRCEKFVYGGCKGNQNNFVSFRGCEIRCQKETKATITGAPTRKSPSTAAPTTKVVITEAPETEALTTEAATTKATTPEVPTTEATTTKVPTTKATTTEVPTTKATTTDVPTTQATTTEVPTTKATTTEAPTTEATTTEVPTTKATTTEVPTTEATTTAAPTTEATTTAAPTTEATTTAAQTTQATTTEVPTTKATTTEAPTTEATSTKVPTTEATTTAAPTTEATTTEVPTTEATTTDVPTTKATTTDVPTTQATTTEVPTTKATTTEAPTTEATSTKVPTTEATTTAAPTTEATTTEVPTTEATTTTAPTTEATTTTAQTTQSKTTAAQTTQATTTAAPATKETTTEAARIETTTPVAPTTEAKTNETTKAPTQDQTTKVPKVTVKLTTASRMTLQPPVVITEDQFGLGPDPIIKKTTTNEPLVVVTEELLKPSKPETTAIPTTADLPVTSESAGKETTPPPVIITEELIRTSKPTTQAVPTTADLPVTTESKAKDTSPTTIPPPVVITEEMLRPSMPRTTAAPSIPREISTLMPPSTDLEKLISLLPLFTEDLTKFAVDYTTATTRPVPATEEKIQVVTTQPITDSHKETVEAETVTKPAEEFTLTRKPTSELTVEPTEPEPTQPPEIKTLPVKNVTETLTEPVIAETVDTRVPNAKISSTLQPTVKVAQTTIAPEKEEVVTTPTAVSEPATKCLQMRSKFLSQLSGASSSLLPGLQFVPNCDEKGNFERIQCWTMLGLCWCVGPHDGKELPGSRVNVSQGGEPDCFKSQISVCERSRIEALKLIEKRREVGNPIAATYLPKCDASGLYEEVQCLLSKKKCWCVDKKTGLPVAGKGVPDSLTCIKKEETKCQKVRKLAIKLAEADFDDEEDLLGPFIPTCDEEGNYAEVQCLKSSGFCWCVDENGEEVIGTKTRGVPNCKKVDKPSTECQKQREDSLKTALKIDGKVIPAPGVFLPTCEADGRYSPLQCHQSIGTCWCVDKNGTEVDGTRTKESRPNCDRAPTKCEKLRRQILSGLERVPDDERSLTRLPSCDGNGNFNQIQCWNKINECWCVDQNGNEVPHTRVSSGEPDCKKRKLTKCQKELEASAKEPSGSFVAECTRDGGYKDTQCHDGNCWCVDEKGIEIDGTRTEFGHPDCDSVNLTKCQKQEKEASKLASQGLHVPQCKKDGSFLELQCHESESRCWCVNKEGEMLPGTSYKHAVPQCKRLLESKLSPCEYKRKFLYVQHDGKVPNWLYIPQCEVNGSYSRQQCNIKSRRCWCVNENGDMTRWVGRNESSNVCSKVPQSECEKKKEKVYNKAFLINKRYPVLPLGIFMPECNKDGSFKEMQCHESYCWCVSKDGREIEDSRRRFESPECKRILSGNLTVCEIERRSLLETEVDDGSLFVPQCKSNGQYERMQCNKATGHCWCVDSEGKMTEWATNNTGKFECPGLNEPITVCEQRQRDVYKLARVMNKMFPMLPLGANLPECNDDGSFKSIQCNEGFCWCVAADGKEIPHTLTRFDVPQCDRITSGNLTKCERLRDEAIKENANTEVGRRHVFRCDQTGSFERDQCNANIGTCWCVNEHGVTVDGSATLNGIPDCIKRNTSKCQNLRQDAFNRGIIGPDGISVPLLGAFLPVCKEDGSFSQIQCHESECWCVDDHGAEREGTKVTGENPDCRKRPLSICEQKRKEVHKNATVVDGRPILPLGLYVPQCKENGDFEEMQCHSSTGYCWCVDNHGHEIPKTSRRLEKPQCHRISAGNLTKCEQANFAQLGEDPLNPPQDAFLFDCDLNGQFVPKQCDGFLNICWCVNSDGAMIDGSETKGGNPDCTPRNNTPCQQKRQDVFNMAVVLVGRSVVAPGAYLPKCKANGDFEEVQCHGSERFCWCVDKNGEKPIDFTHPSKDLQCDRLLAGNLTKCERFRADTYGKGELPQEAFLPECKPNGDFKVFQCNGFINECWCVDEDGKYIEGTQIKEGIPECPEPVSLSKCQKQQEKASKSAIKIDGVVIYPPGLFVPSCEEDGSFSPVQCHGSTGFCFCVNKDGKEIPHTRLRHQKPKCDGTLDKRRLCISERSKDPDVQCEPDGSYKKVQCKGLWCWCVDKDGVRVSEKQPNVPGEKFKCPNAETKCLLLAKEAKNKQTNKNGTSILIVGVFVPKCTEKGDFESVQCHPSTGYCWCVDRDGEEIAHTKTREGKPQCNRLVLNNLTNCEETRKKAIDILKELVEKSLVFVPKCRIDGSFNPVQCWKENCWCVDKNGDTINGTETTSRPLCSEGNKTIAVSPKPTAKTTAVNGATTEAPEPKTTIPVVEATTDAPEPVTTAPVIEATTGAPEPVTTGPVVEATTDAPEPVTTASVIEATTGAPEPVTTGPVVEATTDAPEPVTTAPVIEATTGAPEPVTTGPVVEATTDAPEPVTTAPVIEATTGAPEPVTTAPVVEATTGALELVTTAPVIEATTNAPEPVTTAPVVEATTGAPEPVTTGPVVEATTGALELVTTAPVIEATTNAPEPVTTALVIEATTEAPEPVTTAPVVEATTDAPGPVTTAPVVEATTDAPEPVTTAPVVEATTEDPELVTTAPVIEATTGAPEPVTTAPVVEATTDAPGPVTTAPVVKATTDAPEPVTTAPVVEATTEAPEPVTTAPVIEATTGAPEPVTTAPVVEATTDAPEPVTTAPVVEATTEAPELVTIAPVVEATTKVSEPVTTVPVAEATTEAPELVTAAPIVEVTTDAPEPVTTAPVVGATTEDPELVTTAPVVEATTEVPEPVITVPVAEATTEAPELVTAAPVVAATTEAPGPVTTAPVVEATTDAPEPVTTAHVVEATTEAPELVTTAPVIEATTGAPEPVTTAPVVEATTDAPEPVTTAPVVEATTEAPELVTTAPVIEATTGAPEPVTTAPVVEATTDAPEPVTTAPVVEATTEAPELVTTASVIEATTGAPEPVTTAAVVEATTDAPESVTTAPVVVATTEAPELVTTAPVVEATTEVPEPVTTAPIVEATTDAPELVTTAPVVEVTTETPELVTNAPVIEATTDAPEPVTTAPVVEATTEALEPVTTVPVVEATTDAPEPVTTDPVVEATTEALEPVTTVPVVEATTDAPEPVITAPVVEATTDAPGPVTTAPVVKATTDAPGPMTTAPVVEATTDAPEPVTTAPVVEATTEALVPVPTTLPSVATTVAQEPSTTEAVKEIKTIAPRLPSTLPTTEPTTKRSGSAQEPPTTDTVKEVTTSAPEPSRTSPATEPVTEATTKAPGPTTKATAHHISACFLPADPGPCKGRKLRYYYSNDPSVKDCVAFMYGGCRGNGNNFESAEECVSKCRDPVSLRTTVPVAKKIESKTVKKIPGCNSEYGCCEDYVTPAKGPNQAGCPVYKHRCEYPKAKGPCGARITRWYYNARLQICNSFIWGGCFGNKNNYQSYESCMEKCKDYQPAHAKELSGETGSIELQTKFIPGCIGDYGCCEDGFSPAKGPNQAGCPVYESICNMPAVKGYCQKGTMVRWYYNAVAGRCDIFRYSGCGGNENNFDTPSKCAEKCETGGSKCEDKIGILCIDWKRKGLCTSRWREMARYCQSTCGFCNKR
ncbi:uncharacterized protein LOC135683288 isoform X1 [Rhopilema esculentum]|uniref:uncharacterized protein LOC135683288 isoform X1 n=1 Tax=Rhopilema esculentum TaxID=499914 RepID=UPI0031E272CF